MKRVSVAGLAALVVLAGCATQKAEPIAGFWKQVPPISEPDAKLMVVRGAAHTSDGVDHSYDIYNPPAPSKQSAAKAEAERDAAMNAPIDPAEAKREHQQAQITAIAAECRYELDAHPGPGYRAARGFGLGGAIAGTFIEAAMNGAIQKQHFAECVQARAMAVDAGLN